MSAKIDQVANRRFGRNEKAHVRATAPRKILVIDDDESILLTTSALLEDEGYQVLRKNTALGASSLLLRERPDLILLDVGLPALQGDALALLIQQNQRLSGVRILLYSGASKDRLEDLVLSTGAAGYVQKGCLPGVLLRRIRRLLSTEKAE